MAKAKLPKHILIVGHGRSGTNMVLDLFDCHRNTFCRNEPNELVGTAFTGLGDNMFPRPVPENFDIKWRAALAETFRASGARDRFRIEKDYFRSDLRARVGQSLMSRPKFRACILPRVAGVPTEQWPCSKLYYDHAALARAVPVLKILLSPAWAIRAHRLMETHRIVHVVRRPQEFVQSWWSRYVTGISGGPEKVFSDNQPSLARILKHFDRADEMPQHYSLEALIVSELWRWRYINEIMLNKLSGSERYIMLPYEEVMRNKLHWAEKIYDFAGLEMSPNCRRLVKTMENTLFKGRKLNGLDAPLVEEAINRVIDGSSWRAQLLDVVPAPEVS